MVGEFRQLGDNLVPPGVVDVERDQIGIGHVAIVVGFFFYPLEDGLSVDIVPASRGFRARRHLDAGLSPSARLLLELIFNRVVDRAKRVEIFDFNNRRAHFVPVVQIDHGVDVWLEAHVPFLHDAFCDAEESTDVAKLFGKRDDFIRGLKVRLRDDLQERRPRPVVINDGVINRRAARLVVEQLAGVLFEMSADDADALGALSEFVCRIGNIHGSIKADRHVKLTNLIPLGQVGVVVVLAVPLGFARDGAA